MKRFLNKYFSSFFFFYNELGFKLLLIIVFSFSVGLLDGLGLTIFIPLLELVGNQKTISDTTQTSIDTIINTFGININFTNILLLMLTIFFLKGLFKFISSSYQVFVFQGFIKILRIKMFQNFNKIRFKYFSTIDIGRVQNTFTTEVDRVTNACRLYMNCIESSVLILTYIILAFLSNTEFTFLVIIGGVLTNFIYKAINKSTKKQSGILVKRNSLYQGVVIQYVNLFKYLKVSGRIRIFSKKINDQILKVEKVNKKIGLLNSVSLSVREPLMIFILVVVMYIQVSVLNGSLELILLSILFFYRALQKVLSFQSEYNKFLSMEGSLINIQDFQDELINQRDENGDVNFQKFNNTIELKNINFSYGNKLILNQINLYIKKNETIALVGESGSGKSTLINILACLLPIDSGEYTLDGINIKNINKISLQKRIGYITQESIIFNDTLYNNVTYFEEKNELNIIKFNKAIKESQLKDFVSKLPEKENTIIGNNGINLSGGQRQRISIAREFYKDSDFLFMDEATSALDSENENFIQKNINKMKGMKTIVISAHRLSTIKNADRIIVLDKGNIMGDGSFNELIEENPLFQRMVEFQEL